MKRGGGIGGGSRSSSRVSVSWMILHYLRATILPITIIIVIPFLLYSYGSTSTTAINTDTYQSSSSSLSYLNFLPVYDRNNPVHIALHVFSYIVAVFAGSFGIGLILWTLFHSSAGLHDNDGPPKKLVVVGSYQHVRNPMITGMNLVLIMEAIFAWNIYNNIWIRIFGITFLILTTIYIVYHEEPILLQTYGDDYTNYYSIVPRYIPNLTPYDKYEHKVINYDFEDNCHYYGDYIKKTM
mmetsp:Transcript_7173/g.7019  ORF Transcript_7173/g.7019 Transcript_7173/m.7019 type:complete len:239 (+) Transcript_7173:79-795(+)